MYYAMTDIHGCYDEFKQALSHWNPRSEKLVVLGDLIDRGPDSLKVIRELMNLHDANPDNVIVLKGNHDESFVAWALDTPIEDLGFYYMDMHNATIESFYEGNTAKFKNASKRQRGEFIRHNFRKELRFLATRPMYHETKNIIFVHAGINLKSLDWHTDTRVMNHVRSPFIYSSIKAPKRVFFGHTPTENLHVNKSNNIWFSKEADKVAIDGGVVFGGQLNAVKISENSMIQDVIKIPKYKFAVTTK